METNIAQYNMEQRMNAFAESCIFINDTYFSGKKN